MDKAEVINKAIEFSQMAKQFLSFNHAVLFGSYVNGQPREDSDIDIAFFVNDSDLKLDYYSLLISLNKLARKIDSRIEPHIFSNKSITGFSEMVWSNGKEIIV